MKANELMIGDLVYNHRNWTCPIVEVHKDSAVVIARHYGEEEFKLSDLRPIPLTPEILEKNGFVLESYLGNVMSGKWWTRNDFVIHENMNDSVGKNNFKYKYVHQLQHALRLCGIEKEIKL